MSTWRAKPGQPFEALQVAPDTVPEIVKACHRIEAPRVAVRYLSDDEIEIEFADRGTPKFDTKTALQGAWMLFQSNGHISVMADSAFRGMYEPVQTDTVTVDTRPVAYVGLEE